MKNAPVESKLTTKGNIPDKLATVGVDASKLHNYTVAIADGEVDIASLAEQIADTVVDTVCSTYPSEVWESVNGTGYVAKWKEQIVADVVATATGTAVQGRAFKQTICANVDGCTMEHFTADGKGAGKKEVKANPFLQG